jgi:hypothetical protein
LRKGILKTETPVLNGANDVRPIRNVVVEARTGRTRRPARFSGGPDGEISLSSAPKRETMRPAVAGKF